MTGRRNYDIRKPGNIYQKNAINILRPTLFGVRARNLNVNRSTISWHRPSDPLSHLIIGYRAHETLLAIYF